MMILCYQKEIRGKVREGKWVILKRDRMEYIEGNQGTGRCRS